MRISDWSSDVCSSDLGDEPAGFGLLLGIRRHGIIFARLRRAPSSALRAPSPAAQEKGLGVAPLLRSGRGVGVRARSELRGEIHADRARFVDEDGQVVEVDVEDATRGVGDVAAEQRYYDNTVELGRAHV